MPIEDPNFQKYLEWARREKPVDEKIKTLMRISVLTSVFQKVVFAMAHEFLDGTTPANVYRQAAAESLLSLRRLADQWIEELKAPRPE